jgi:hypothetical protein
VAGQLSWPSSPGPGIVCQRQTSFPVSASYAWTLPRIENSPPETPVITLPS